MMVLVSGVLALVRCLSDTCIWRKPDTAKRCRKSRIARRAARAGAVLNTPHQRRRPWQQHEILRVGIPQSDIGHEPTRLTRPVIVIEEFGHVLCFCRRIAQMMYRGGGILALESHFLRDDIERSQLHFRVDAADIKTDDPSHQHVEATQERDDDNR
jgi:hypothetical protein